MEKLYEQKTGNEVPSILLDNLAETWLALPRRGPLSPKYVVCCKALLKKFTQFIRSMDKDVKMLEEINQRQVIDFLKAEEARGISAKTYNDTLKFLKSMWSNLLPGFPNPLLGLPTKALDTKFRKPFTEEQLAKILDSAQKDPFIYPILVTGMCTAMRRGDCCLLKWSDVDLNRELISVQTAKTGAQAVIPIWPLFRSVLKRQLDKKSKGDIHVFPEQAKMYQKNADGITWRVKKVFEDAQVFSEHNERKDCQRIRYGSEYDFHSFRVTWITLALSHGVPIEIVQKVTGHATVDVVTKHYFQPNRQDFQRVLSEKLPDILQGTSDPKDPASLQDWNLITKLKSMNPDNWETIRDELIKHYEIDY